MYKYENSILEARIETRANEELMLKFSMENIVAEKIAHELKISTLDTKVAELYELLNLQESANNELREKYCLNVRRDAKGEEILPT